VIYAGIALLALLLTACDGGDPNSQPPPRTTGWEIGPVMDGQNFSKNCPTTFTDTFTIGPCEPHYVTRATGPLTGKTQVSLRFKLEGDKLHGASPECSKGPATLDLHFSANVLGEQWEVGRWWASFAQVSNLSPGEYSVTAPFSGRWTAVVTSNAHDSPEAFKTALAKADRIGFTFGDCTGRGHGVASHGQTRFTLLEWAVE